MAKIENFEDVQAWQKARELTQLIYSTTSRPPFVKDFFLRDQIRSASISIMANIAEGFGRKSNKEFANFLNIAHGSAAEVQSHLFVALDLNYLGKESFNLIYSDVEAVSKMIQKFMNYLNSSTP